MSEKKLTQEELVRQIDKCWYLYTSGESKISQQACTQIKEIVEFYFNDSPKEGHMKIADHPNIPFYRDVTPKSTVTLAEITELSARLRDTSRQSLYETKLRRWLESKGMEVEDG